IPRGTILRGRVIDENGSTRPGIKITLSCQSEGKQRLAPRTSQEVVTGSDGAFALAEPLAAGSFAVNVDGVELVEPREVEIRESEATRFVDVRVRGFSDADAIIGVVNDDHGEPVPKASIDYYPRGGQTHQMLDTAKDGTFRIQRTADD